MKVKKIIIYTLAVVTVVLLNVSFGTAQNYISVKIVSDEMAMIELKNSDPVAGLQFTLNVQDGIAFESFQKEGRFAEESWFVSANNKNDTTLNVIAINSHLDPLPPGNGAIAKIYFKKDVQFPSNLIQFRLSNVILSDKNGNSIPVDLQPTNNHSPNSNQTSGNLYGLQNYPNPFNPITTITYKIEKTSRVQIAIYDMLGKVLRSLCDEIQPEGYHSIRWNSTNSQNQEVASGTYIYRLLVDGNATTKTLLLEK
ncbi:MAG: T9SS type A sorting domain-containing protein [Ignavibacteriales bacterium]|nr:T9SS type A sorting domain-containing protein [Ignavibacteriales bacterium]